MNRRTISRFLGRLFFAWVTLFWLLVLGAMVASLATSRVWSILGTLPAYFR